MAWLAESKIPQSAKKHPTINATLSVVRKMCKKIELLKQIGPMTPILGNPSFEPGLKDRGFNNLRRKGISRLTHFMIDNHVMQNEEMEQVYGEDIDLWRRNQLRTYIGSLKIRVEDIGVPSKFEEICLKREPMRHMLSYMYNLINEANAPQELVFIQAWERDLDIKFSETQKNKIFSFTHKASMASRYHEGGYKVLTRWYRTPMILNRIFPNTSKICWRCQKEEGTMIHMFWSCQKLKEFWNMVSGITREITGVNLGDRPAAYLLFDIPMSLEKYKQSLLRHLLTAAKACIPILWKSTAIPTRSQWLSRINEIQLMENLTMGIREREEEYRRTWTPYSEYRDRNP